MRVFVPLEKAFRRLRNKFAARLYEAGVRFKWLKKPAIQQRYEDEQRRFEALGGVITHRFPFLADYEDRAGTAKGHYFHQDLLVASFIHAKNPRRHVDIGSRIDGFVAHVAAFRKIEVIDLRDLGDTGHGNILFVKADIMDDANIEKGITDSISCLHALEHFGLGRYGDQLDPHGHMKGFRNIVRMLQRGGTLYISFPIGRTNEVHFNAHRVFDPWEIFSWIQPEDQLTLERFDYVDDEGSIHTNVDVRRHRPATTYGCGIYTFSKA